MDKILRKKRKEEGPYKNSSVDRKCKCGKWMFVFGRMDNGCVLYQCLSCGEAVEIPRG
jgi:hypothetical protein